MRPNLALKIVSTARGKDPAPDYAKLIKKINKRLSDRDNTISGDAIILIVQYILPKLKIICESDKSTPHLKALKSTKYNDSLLSRLCRKLEASVSTKTLSPIADLLAEHARFGQDDLMALTLKFRRRMAKHGGIGGTAEDAYFLDTLGTELREMAKFVEKSKRFGEASLLPMTQVMNGFGGTPPFVEYLLSQLKADIPPMILWPIMVTLVCEGISFREIRLQKNVHEALFGFRPGPMEALRERGGFFLPGISLPYETAANAYCRNFKTSSTLFVFLLFMNKMIRESSTQTTPQTTRIMADRLLITHIQTTSGGMDSQGLSNSPSVGSPVGDDLRDKLLKNL